MKTKQMKKPARRVLIRHGYDAIERNGKVDKIIANTIETAMTRIRA